jgi:hypothetical protein
MKHLVTLIQVLIWFFIDIFLMIYYLRWNQFMYKPNWNGFIKEKNGIVRRASNCENYKTQYENKYMAAFS